MIDQTAVQQSNATALQSRPPAATLDGNDVVGKQHYE
jgi:hypothetical protein